MKTLRLFLPAAAVCFTAARCLAEPVSDAELEKIPRADIIRTIRHQQELAADGQARAGEAEKYLAETQKQLSQAKAEGTALKTHVTEIETSAQAVERDRDAERERAEAMAAEAAKQKAEAAKWRKESDRRGNLLGWLSAAACVFLSLQIMRFIPMPYALAAPLLAAPAGYFLARLLT
jgi:uncharacterized membrane protein YqiK